MKYAYYDKEGRLLGWYDKEIHSNIPEPYLEVTDKQWKEAINNNYNFVDIENKKLGKKDFRTLKELKFAKKQEIESAYQKAIQEPIQYIVNSNTYIFQADKKSQDILSQIIAVAPINFETDWLDINNNPIHVTLDDLKGLAQAILARGQQLFAKKVTLKKQIEQCTDKKCLEQIKWA